MLIKYNENIPQKNHLGSLVMFHSLAAKQYKTLLQSCLLCGHIISLEH